LEELEQLAIALQKAELTKTAIRPLRDAIGITAIDKAYQIQHINTQARIKAGAKLVGKKIGLTSKAVQHQLGVDQPDYGMLFNDMQIENEGSISMQEMMQPKAEAEIAFVLAKDLNNENLTMDELIDAIDYALPSIEIVGSRIENWNIKITDTIADNASASHFVLGNSKKKLSEFDVVNCQMNLIKNGNTVSSGTGADCLGSPLIATLWLAKKMIDLKQPLQAGELILSGALGPMSAVEAGDHIEAEIEGLGSVSISFEK